MLTRALVGAAMVAVAIGVSVALIAALSNAGTTEERVAIIGLGGVLVAAVAGAAGAGLGSWIAARATDRAATTAAEQAEKDR